VVYFHFNLKSFVVSVGTEQNYGMVVMTINTALRKQTIQCHNFNLKDAIMKTHAGPVNGVFRRMFSQSVRVAVSLERWTKLNPDFPQ